MIAAVPQMPRLLCRTKTCNSILEVQPSGVECDLCLCRQIQRTQSSRKTMRKCAASR